MIISCPSYVMTPFEKIKRPRGIAILIILLFCPSLAYADDSIPGAQTVVDGKARFIILSPTLIRLEYAENKRFEDGHTINVINRDFSHPEYKTSVVNGWREIETSKLLLRYKTASGPFGADNLVIELVVAGKRIQVVPDWEGRLNTGGANLGGWKRALKHKRGPIKLHDGLLSRDGWYLLNDTWTALWTKDRWVRSRPSRDGAYQDGYFFGYGRDYQTGLQDFIRLTGPAPLLPRWAFGIWYSRWHRYSADDYQEKLLAKFRAEKVPLDVLVIDTDFKSPRSWNGWNWNDRLFPNPQSFMEWTEQMGLKVSLNVHASIHKNDPQFPLATSLARDLIPWRLRYVWDWGKREHVKSYFALHEPFEQDGCDFWWNDWCCDGSRVSLPGVVPDTWINYLYARRMTDQGKRGFAFSRIGGSYQDWWKAPKMGPWAEHRYAVHFTGDTFSTWAMMGFQIDFTIREGNIGIPYVSHDIGGFLGIPLNPGLYNRWVQFGAFQPIFRLHSHIWGRRLPWHFNDEVRIATETFMRLRHGLIPYIYTLAWQAHRTGMPLIRGMYLHYPEDSEAYTHKHQYLFGEQMLVAPVTKRGKVASTTVWFPEGTWIHFFTGKTYVGPAVKAISSDLNTMPVFVKAGGIIPMQPYMDHVGQRPVNPLKILVYAGANGSFTLYEDAGEGLSYQVGEFLETPIAYRENSGSLLIEAGQGGYRGMLTQRDYDIQFVNILKPSRVTIGGRLLPPVAAGSGEGWWFDSKSKQLRVYLKARSISDDVVIQHDATTRQTGYEGQ